MNSLPNFETFFKALWGEKKPPFPWQIRLATQLDDGRWPDFIDLPTGTGKTSVLDIALYRLAVEAHLPPTKRKAPVRIVFAVNRRIVVDEAFNRAHEIAKKLKDALRKADNKLHPFAVALQNLARDEEAKPLEAYPLRGATFTDSSWARTPTQPLILTTTLDQLGSRLLFRGYGVSSGARPIHAALLANDSLLILDEAHTSRAFSQTLAAISQMRTKGSEVLTTPFAYTQLTATPPTNSFQDKELFQLNKDDHDCEIIQRRISASKPATLESNSVEKAKGGQRHARLAKAFSQTLIEDARFQNCRRILIVVNRVATAEALLSELTKAFFKEKEKPAIELLTGRIRSLDRDELISRLKDKHQLQSDRPDEDVPRLILVATQTVEVGADFDFDALLTELAPLDSLRQRFGRLNRYGRNIPAPACIFAPGDSLDTKKPDPIYGDCLPLVWKWLLKTAQENEIDFGSEILKGNLPTTDAELNPLLAPSTDAPLLLAPHLDLLAQTSPTPHIEPEVGLYIHGPQQEFPTVSIVLRRGLHRENPLSKENVEILNMTPPLSTEAAAIPLMQAREWLVTPADTPAKEISPDNSSDGPALPISQPRESKVAHPAWIFRESKAELLENARDLRPGDTLILPVESPNLERLIFFPGHEPISYSKDEEPNLAFLDQYERAHLAARDTLSLRLDQVTLQGLLAAFPESERPHLQALIPAQGDSNENESFSGKEWESNAYKILSILINHRDREHPWSALWQKEDVRKNIPQEGWRALCYPSGGAILSNRARIGFTAWPLEPESLLGQTAYIGAEILLADHATGVTHRAETNAASAPCPPAIAEAIRLAAKWHDMGKLDPRFQAWLYGIAPDFIFNKPAIGKSAGPRSMAVNDALRLRSRLKKGFRHEFLSTLIAASSETVQSQPERDLILHLIATHHGHARAIAKPVLDDEPEDFDASMDGETIAYQGRSAPLASFADGATARFWSLTRRFGWWGLPYLESLLRLADQRQSAAEARDTDSNSPKTNKTTS